MPKSSMASRTPSGLELAAGSSRTVSLSSIRTLSVISRTSELGGQAALARGAGDVVDHLGVLELAAGEVDVEGQRLVPVGGALRCQAAACRQASRSTQAPSGRISPVASARGMNSVGGTRPRAGWFQRHRASTPVIWPDAEVEGRLVVQEQLPGLQGAPQVGLELHPCDQLGVHPGVVALEPALAGRLGPVHGQVGVAQQLVGPVDVAVHPGDADAGADVQLAVVDQERLAQASRIRSATVSTLGVVAGVLDQHGELVAAEAGHGVARAARRPAQPLRRPG